MKKVDVIGAGLAGCEASYQLIKRGIAVRLWEMRPHKMTAAHHSGDFAELVCSNSLRSNDPLNAIGLLKQELRELDSLIMKVADRNAIPAGKALAVDRKQFAREITEYLRSQPLVEICNQEYLNIQESPTIIASGPLTSDGLSVALADLTGVAELYFYDALAPVIAADSVDYAKVYFKSRYDSGSADYLNCPLDKEQFTAFYQALLSAEVYEVHEFDKFFPGCLPIEEMAKKGEKTLLFGPMKPVGLEIEGKRPYAVVQLRRDDFAASLYNIVGFQTQLTQPQQKKVLRMIPGLENCEIVRYGMMHRNTYINSPLFLDNNFRFKDKELFFAGQISGVEGYLESTASGWVAGVNMVRLLQRQELLDLKPTTMIGALANYVARGDAKAFQPSNANYGIMSLSQPVRGSQRKAAYAMQSHQELESLITLI